MCDWKMGGWRIIPMRKNDKSYRIIGGGKTVAIGVSEEIAAYIADMHNARFKIGHEPPHSGEAVTDEC